jgi:hypothetical protein
MHLPVEPCWSARWVSRRASNVFTGKATAEDIIAEVQRGRSTLHQINTQTDH